MKQLQRPDGVTLAFEVHNPQAPGVPLLLTHGFGATSGMWDPNIHALSVDRPVIVWDQRGHGSTDAPDDMNLYSEQIGVADMAAILDIAARHRLPVVVWTRMRNDLRDRLGARASASPIRRRQQRRRRFSTGSGARLREGVVVRGHDRRRRARSRHDL